MSETRYESWNRCQPRQRLTGMKRLVPVLLLAAACTGSNDPLIATTTITVADESFYSRQAPIQTDDMIAELEDGTYVGYLQWVSTEGLTGGGEIHFDLAVWFRGDEAEAAATADGDEALPAGYYIRNLDPHQLVLGVRNDVEITSVWYQYDEYNDLEDRPMTFQQLAEVWDNTPDDVRSNLRNSPWWITVVNGEVIAINEQYVP